MFQDDENCQQISTYYSRNEFRGMLFLLGAEWAMFSAVIGINAIFKTNEHRLPIHFFIIFLPFEGISFNWLVNLLFQTGSLTCAAFIFFAYISTVLVMFDHTCWSMDILMILIQYFDADQEEKDPKIQREQNKKRFKTAYEMHLNVLDWMDQVQNTIQFNFLVEFSIFSLLICMCIYTVADDPFSFGYVNQLLVALLVNLFISSVMGTRVIKKIEELTDAVYSVKWYNYDVETQKRVKMMLQVCQNMKGYNGIFKAINMETFQEV